MGKYKVSIDEWLNLYEFNKLNEEEKSEFISRAEAQKYYRKIIKPSWRPIFHNKEIFLKKWSGFIHRKWLEVLPSTSEEDIREFLKGKVCIIKPSSGSLGQGVYKADCTTDRVIDQEVTRLKGSHSLIEECMVGCEELQRFHPTSLNTIRVVTVRGVDGITVFGSFVRFGRGDSVVDNAHAGGIFANIDVDSGIVNSDGMNVSGERFKKHPDSGLEFKGLVIPQWEKICSICIEAHKLCPNFVVGWDAVVTNNGEIEFVEGNHAPDVDVLQGPLRKGIRAEFLKAVGNFKSFKG